MVKHTGLSAESCCGGSRPAILCVQASTASCILSRCASLLFLARLPSSPSPCQQVVQAASSTPPLQPPALSLQPRPPPLPHRPPRPTLSPMPGSPRRPRYTAHLHHRAACSPAHPWSLANLLRRQNPHDRPLVLASKSTFR